MFLLELLIIIVINNAHWFSACIVDFSKTLEFWKSCICKKNWKKMQNCSLLWNWYVSFKMNDLPQFYAQVDFNTNLFRGQKSCKFKLKLEKPRDKYVQECISAHTCVCLHLTGWIDAWIRLQIFTLGTLCTLSRYKIKCIYFPNSKDVRFVKF